MTSTDLFISRICAVDASLESELEHERTLWAPEPIPAVMRCARLGEAVGSLLGSMSAQSVEAIFEAVEQALADESSSTVNAVATGFLEALLTRSDQGVLPPDLFWSSLGPQARAYVEAWDAFTTDGSGPPGVSDARE